ncbi:MAG: hypothetical protein ACI9OJ_003359, partial [Myxococcota bacterium]
SHGPAEPFSTVSRRVWNPGNVQQADPKGAFKLVSVDRIDGAQTHATVRYEYSRSGASDRGTFATVWQDGALQSARLLSGETVSGSGDAFVDEAVKRGLIFTGEPDPRFMPPSKDLKFQIIRHAVGGASAGDFNGDGFDDVLLTRGTDLRLFKNVGGVRFEDVTEQAGLAGIRHANATVFADFDDDGDADLYIGCFYGRNRLFQNTGSHFTDVTADSGLAADDMTAVLSVADFDGDGRLDLYIGRFLDARTEIPTMIHYARNGAKNRLYLGRGDLAFTDVSERSGADDSGFTLGVAAVDYDGDGDVDLYLANDFGRNVLLQNQGDARFVDVAKSAGALAVSAGMSASFGDYDGDGLPDIYVSSVRSNQRWFSTDLNIRGYVLRIVQTERRKALQDLFLDLRKHLGDDWDQLGQMALAGNHLLRNRGDGTFENVSEVTGARPFGWYWSSGFFDVDNDGDEDIVAANGWITGPEKHDL